MIKLILIDLLIGFLFLNMIFGKVIDVWILFIGILLIVMLFGVKFLGFVVGCLIVSVMFGKEFGFVCFDWMVIFEVIRILDDLFVDRGRFVVNLFIVWMNFKKENKCKIKLLVCLS